MIAKNTSKTITRRLLVDRLLKNTELNKEQARCLVESFFDIISKELANGKNVKIAGWGTFYLLNKSQRIGRNPRTGEEAIVRARRVVAFQASHQMRATIDNFA